jgi:hypothetical protein
MTDLLLRVRLEALQQNLRQVANLIDLIHDNGNSVRTLYRLLDGPAAPIKTGLTRAGIASETLRGLLKDNDDLAAALNAYPEALQQLRGVPDDLALVRKELDTARREVKQLLGSVEETDALFNHESIQDIFGDAARSLLMDAAQLQEQLPGRERDKPPQEATPTHWETFRALVGDRERLSVFKEYVDVAGGLSLRGHGMDEQFCAMADWLSEHWTRVIGLPYWFSIPARDEARLMTHIIIPVGFPEWTIWAVPLFAHEVGCIFVDKNRTLQGFTVVQAKALSADKASTSEGVVKAQARPARKRMDARQARIRTYLADAFATYVMGPAYACASLLLKLDPAGVGRDDQERGWDHVRARVILNTLKRISPEVYPEMVDIIVKLEESWKVAVERFAPAESTGNDLDLVEPVITQAVETLRRLEQVREEPIGFDDYAWGRAKRFAGQVFANLHDRGVITSAETAGDRPPSEQASGDVSARHQTAEATAATDGRADISLPLVLNAAWYQRVARPDPDTTAIIARWVREEIWLKLRNQKVSGRSESMGTPRRGGYGLGGGAVRDA